MFRRFIFVFKLFFKCNFILVLKRVLFQVVFRATFDVFKLMFIFNIISVIEKSIFLILVGAQ